MEDEPIFLVQTDTTVGLSSKNFQKLNKIKKRSLSKPCLLTLGNLSSLKEKVRVPKNFRKRVRRAKKTTFIYQNSAYRVVSEDCPYRDLLLRVGELYSTSANKTQKSFDKSWALSICDIVIETKEGFQESTPSKIFSLGRRKLKKIR